MPQKGVTKTLMTVPGRLGDGLFRLPVAYQYAKQTGNAVSICIDHTLTCMLPLLQQQDWVSHAFFDAGITNWDNGGQPWDFGGGHDYFYQEWQEVFHLGYRVPPDGNLTMATLQQSGVPLDVEHRNHLLSEPCLKVKRTLPKFLCIHVSAGIQHNSPHTRNRNIDAMACIQPVLGRLVQQFEEVFVVGTGQNEQTRYLLGLGLDKIKRFDDHCNLNTTLKLLGQSVLIGTYSSMWALASIAKLPQVVIMDRTHYRPDKIAGHSEAVVFPDNSEGLFHWVCEQRERWKTFGN